MSSEEQARISSIDSRLVSSQDESMMLRNKASLAVVLLISSLATQHPGRRPDVQPERTILRGSCVARDGSPWIHTRVICYSSILGHVTMHKPRPADVDEVVALTDKRGRFRARLLSGRSYSVWALSRDGERTSRIYEDVIGSGLVRIAEAPTIRTRSIKLAFLAAEQHPVNASYHLLWSSSNQRSTKLELKEDTLALAQLPRMDCSLVCLSAAGDLLGLRHVQENELAQSSLTWGFGRHRTRELVVKGEDGKPLAGATILLRPLGRTTMPRSAALEAWNQEKLWWRVAQTDAQGLARFVLPEDEVREVLIRARGYRDAYQQLESKKPCLLQRQKQHRLRLMFGAQALKETRLLALSKDPVPARIGTLTVMRNEQIQPTIYETDAEGYVEIPGQENVRIELLLDRRTRQLLEDRTRVLRTVLLGSIRSAPGATEIFQLDQLGWKQILVVAADGRPIPFPSVCVLAQDKPGNRPSVVYRGNRRGQIELCLPKGEFSILAVVKGMGWAEMTLAGNEPQYKLTLKPFAQLGIQVLTNAGEAVPHARLRFSGAFWPEMRTFFWQVSSWNSRLLTCTCDARGHAALELIPWPGQIYSISASDALGQQRLHGRNNLSTDALPTVLELTLAKARGH